MGKIVLLVDTGMEAAIHFTEVANNQDWPLKVSTASSSSESKTFQYSYYILLFTAVIADEARIFLVYF